MKSYPDRIAEILARAPSAPPLKRKYEAAHGAISENTKAKLLLIHAAYATFGHPTEDHAQVL